MNGNTAISQIARHICTCDTNSILEQHRAIARRRMMDVLGCAFGGAHAPGNQELLALLRQKGGKEESSVWVYGDRLPLEEAAMVNSVLCRSYDYEIMTPAHLYATLIPTALAVGETCGSSLREVLDAVVLASDLCARVVGASGMDIPKGFDPVGTSTLLGAAAVAGRLMKAGEQQMLFAFGHALNMMCGSFENMWAGATSFKFNQGWSSWCGIFAVKLAQIGWTAPTDALQSSAGYYKLYTSNGCVNPAYLTEGLGHIFRDFVIEKPWPSCRFNHSAIQCVLQLKATHLFSPESIEKIIISLPAFQTSLFVCAPFAVREYPLGDALFNMRFNTACALLYGEVKPHSYTEEVIRSPEIRRLADRIEILPLPEGDGRAAAMEVRFLDGNHIETSLDHVKGDVPGSPMTDEELESKFWYNLDFCGQAGRERGRALLALCGGGETAEDLCRLIGRMTAQAEN